jgi:predicted ATP-dependent endonuclease of OLD family
MKLTEINIENFRSIKSETIKIDHNCLILLGKNEAGKSNILKAIAAVFGQYKVTDKDKRKRIANETISSYYIRAIVELLEIDFNEIFDRFTKQYQNSEYILFKNGISILNFIEETFKELVIRIDIAENETTYFTYWVLPESSFELQNDIYLAGTSFNTDKQGKKQEIKEITKLVLEIIKKFYNENPYICHYWQYNSSFLLIKHFMSFPSDLLIKLR